MHLRAWRVRGQHFLLVGEVEQAFGSGKSGGEGGLGKAVVGQVDEAGVLEGGD